MAMRFHHGFFALLTLMLTGGCESVAPAPPPSIPDAAGDSSPRDGSVDAELDADPPDADPGCGTRLSLVSVPVESISHQEPVSPNTGRSTRVWLEVLRSGCDENAMPQVEIDEGSRTVNIRHRVWRADGGLPCEAPEVRERRPVVLRLEQAGSWTIQDSSTGGVAFIMLEVTEAPERPCADTPSRCALDCDCDSVPGAICLSVNSFAGPALTCIRSCEVDRDCLGFSRCDDADDYYERYCSDGRPECLMDTDCPSGYRCDGGACTHDFRLTGATRNPCRCAEDCAEGLDCVGVTGEAMGRCEARCLTQGAGWCPGSHQCGQMEEDLTGLAEVDAVCGFVGE